MTTDNIYNSILIEHGTKPKNFCILKKKNFTRLAINKLCGDKIEIFAHIENNIIENISFKGHGCVIAIASTSIMTEIMKKKKISEAIKIINEFRKEILNTSAKKNTIKYKEIEVLFSNKSSILPSRIKCITLGWYAFYDILHNITIKK